MDQKIGRDFSRLEKYSRRYRHVQLGDLDLKGNEYLIILQTTRHPGISQDQISKNLLDDKSNIARRLQRLEQMGYIERKISSNDRRITEVYPTDLGEKTAVRIRQVLHDWEAILTDGLSEDEKDQLELILQKLFINAEKSIERE